MSAGVYDTFKFGNILIKFVCKEKSKENVMPVNKNRHEEAKKAIILTDSLIAEIENIRKDQIPNNEQEYKNMFEIKRDKFDHENEK